MPRFWDVLMYTILAAMAVLVIMNAKEVAGLLATGGNLWLNGLDLLTGSGYNNRTIRKFPLGSGQKAA